jgi:hypothetical protein
VPTPCPYQCYGDADNKTEGLSKYRVYSSDLTRLKTCWAKSATVLKSMGLLDICLCADSDHAGEGLSKYRVYSSDLSRLKTFWAKAATWYRANGYPLCPQ